MRESTELEAAAEGVVARGLASAMERLGPLSVGAVTTSLLLVTGGRILRYALGAGVSRRLGWSSAAALLTLGLWLLTGPGDAHESAQDSQAEDSRRSEQANEETGG
ncbi:MAG TPA: hypothetical protein VLC48_03095 [Gemmatimonadota bacterium]|nr:hypothetical protein [Gemmatimonadota bacterium]